MKKQTFNLLTLVFLSSVTVQAQSLTEYKNMIQSSWAFKNKGIEQVFDLNPLQTYRLQAVAGQDLNLAPASASPIKTKKIKVAVVDTGVDYTHPLLQKRISYNISECKQLERYQSCLKESAADDCAEQFLKAGENQTDADGNGYPADCHGWSLLSERNTPQNIMGTPDFNDEIGHGTHVAGLVASVSENIEILPIQVISNAPNQPIKPLSLQTFDAKNNEPLAIDISPSEDARQGSQEVANLSERIARGIFYAIHAKADVINLSIGWPQGQDSQLMREAIKAAQQKGIIIVAAAGNDSTQALLRPCQYEGVICVGAARPDGSLAHFSNFGYGVDVAAPGVSLVSTIPLKFRSIRIPGYSGVDILSGTSQASPLVAGVIADLLARGVPASDIYARLVLGARSLQKEKPVKMGPLNASGIEVMPRSSYERYVLSGLVDQKKSLAVLPQPLLLNADKETQLIEWDRQSAELEFKVPIKNYWQSVATQDVQFKVSSQFKAVIYPEISSVELLDESTSEMWEQGAVKYLKIKLKIKDTLKISESRLPSDLTFKVQPVITGKAQLAFETRAEVLFKLTKDTVATDILSIPFSGKLERGAKLFLVDEIYDQHIKDRDYMILKQNENSFDVSLVKFEKNSYQMKETQKIMFDGQINKTRPQQRIRMDLNFDGLSEYILVIQEFKEKNGQYNSGDYILHFYIFDSQFKFVKKFSFYDERVLIPIQYSWLKVGQELRPAWVGQGYPVPKKWDVTDFWSSEETAQAPLGQYGIYLYYLDQNFKLAQISHPKDGRIVDVIQPSQAQVRTGIMPVLVAKNLGTEVKPSYLNEFSLGYIQNLELKNLKKLDSLNSELNYRNLIDTRVDRILNLRSSDDEFRGTFWFGFDTHQRQRVTLIDFKTNQIYDRLLNSRTTIFDSPLRVRSAYLGQNNPGVFLITNTEIEYHDFKSQKSVQSSLNKYTFIGDDLIVDLQFPLTVRAKNSGSLPALYTTEGSGLNTGVKMLVPLFARDLNNSKMIGQNATDQSENASSTSGVLVSPARLHLKTPQGCRALEAPVFLAEKGYALDYFCGDRILRLFLTY